MIKEFFNLFKSNNIQKIEPVPAVLISQGEHSKPKKPSKPKVKKEKLITPKVEPKVEILKFDFDPDNPRLGSIELDWNSEFIKLLANHGYLGATEEEIIDKWLNDVCRTIISNQFPGTSAPAPSTSAPGAKIVNRKNLGSGKTEIS
jgi:hypothetical protein